ncbi:MAG: GxxExxY protein [Luteolibacter sp.]|uniref:GxxExxY protein n=1 Tax=Luteolibacter sp. TaxID=1962973 RepID=UPI003266C5E3
MEMPHQELTGKVIAAAIAVHQDLRPGLDEKLYERALCIEFTEREIHFKQQPIYQAKYKGRLIGNLIPDLVVEDTLIVDAKCVACFTAAHEAQMIGYLAITGLDIGLLLNFKTWPLGKRRLIRPGFQPDPI